MSALGGFLFVFALLFSIGLHEFGHFITAKKFGIKVHQFFIGFGPKLWSIQKGETEYGVKVLPLGGFVRIAGMNPYEEIPEEDRERVFKAKKPWKRAIVLAAGSFTHFLLAFVIVAVVLMTAGRLDFDDPTTTIGAVTPTLNGEPTPAAAADIREGDRVVAVEGEQVRDWEHVVSVIRARAGDRISITLRRDGREIRKQVTLTERRPDGSEGGFLGVGPRFPTERLGPVAAVVESGQILGEGVVASLSSLKDVFSWTSIRQLFSVAAGDAERSAEGPATVVGLTGTAGRLAGDGEFGTFFLLIAFFNIFIGIANLLPLPPLDGGHLAVLAYEKVSRRDVDMRRLIPVTVAVIAAFGSLFLLLLYLDIVRPLPPLQ